VLRSKVRKSSRRTSAPDADRDFRGVHLHRVVRQAEGVVAVVWPGGVVPIDSEVVVCRDGRCRLPGLA
jgi:hypothetical protein